MMFPFTSFLLVSVLLSYGSPTAFVRADTILSHSEHEHAHKLNLTITRMEEVCQRQGYEFSNNYLESNSEYDDLENRRWSPEDEYDGWGRFATTEDPPCPNPQSNLRASYTSHLVPCTFVFHTFEEEPHGPMELSNQCSHNTEINDGSTTVLEDYVVKWPDACVADFRRCYSVERHESVWAKLFCSKRWIIPHGATHVAVDCRVDKATKVQRQDEFKIEREKQRLQEEEQAQKENELYAEQSVQENIIPQENYFVHRQEELQQEATLIFMGVMAVLVFCAGSMVCTYWKVVRPLLKAKIEEESYEMGSLLFQSNSTVGGGGFTSSPISPVSMENGTNVNLRYSLLPNQRRSPS